VRTDEPVELGLRLRLQAFLCLLAAAAALACTDLREAKGEDQTASDGGAAGMRGQSGSGGASAGAGGASGGSSGASAGSRSDGSVDSMDAGAQGGRDSATATDSSMPPADAAVQDSGGLDAASDAGTDTGVTDTGLDCAPGSELQAGVCVDIDECFAGSHMCHATAQCANRDPDYACTCPDGYAGGGIGGAACVARLTLGQNYACEANPAGAVYCWGTNASGQLGDGTRTERAAPTLVQGLALAASVEAGTSTTCAVLRDGRVSCWGEQAGTEWGAGSDTPVLLGGLGDIVQLSLSRASGASDTGCAVDRRGALFCWGGNDVGQTGTGEATGIPLARPKQVEGIGPVRHVQIGWGQGATCVALVTGDAYCWGEGLLTGPSSTTSNVPVKVPSLSDALQVLPGFQRICALRYGGSLRCWGTPALINHTDTGPVSVSVGSAASALSLGLYQTCALNASRHLMCWNAGTAPSRIDSSREFLALDSLGAITIALSTTGSVTAWNMNSAANPSEVPTLSAAQLP
jgi:alpha-tubulin suppressor-like RCC1 family protein